MANDPYYFTHDATAANDPKIRAMIKKYGVAGYGMFWLILEMMRTQSKYKIDDKEYNWSALAEQMQCTCKEVKAFVKDCTEQFELFIYDEKGFYYSASFLKRMQRLDEIRAKRVRAAEIMHEKRREREGTFVE